MLYILSFTLEKVAALATIRTDYAAKRLTSLHFGHARIVEGLSERR